MRFDNQKYCIGTVFIASILLSACGGSTNTSPTSSEPIVAATVPVVTSTGTDFYLTLPDHICVSDPKECDYNPVTNKLIIAAFTATTGEVKFNGAITPFFVAAGGQVVITLDPAVVLTSNELVEAKGIHVTALSPVSVHVVSENAHSADGYLALPTPGLGTKYYVMSYASTGDTGSEFAVVATQNATTVSITPTAAGATRPAGVAFTVMLNAGETYQLANPANADMTATLVTSDKPVAVFGGHLCANIPSDVGYCDYLVEQLPDVSLWGKTFHTSPFSGRTRYTVRVIAAQDNTTFTTVPAGLVGTLNAGQFVDVVLSGAAEFVSSNPVLVAQFMHGYADDSAWKGDPSMVLVTPAEMGMNDATFGVHGLAGTVGGYMNIVTETASLAGLTLDNVAVNTALFTPIGGTSIYSHATIPLATGAHTLLGTVPYSAFVYGYGATAWNAVSYAYPVAAKLSAASTINAGACTDNDDESHSGTGHDDLDELHTGEHPHQHAHDHSHDGAHDHAHDDGDDEVCQE
ncbi:MAG TPA: IgGFc-binding protein [Gallionellaceae bacterium]|nr:IgGFc-binding protein [Gallionellaceae bacterium]